MTARPITTQRVRDAVRVCAPISVRTIIRHLAKGDEHAARDIRRRVTKLINRGEIACTPGPGRADRRVLVIARPAPAPAAEAAPIALSRTPPRIGRWRPPMPRERAPHLIPEPALQPQWPATLASARCRHASKERRSHD